MNSIFYLPAKIRAIAFLGLLLLALSILGGMIWRNLHHFETVLSYVNYSHRIQSISVDLQQSLIGFITETTTESQPIVLNKTLTATDKKFWGYSFFESDIYTTESLFTRSDNYSFAQKGIIAHSIMATSPQDKFYHSVKDETATLNYNLLAKITAAIALGCKNIINGSAKLR